MKLTVWWGDKHMYQKQNHGNKQKPWEAVDGKV